MILYRIHPQKEFLAAALESLAVHLGVPVQEQVGIQSKLPDHEASASECNDHFLLKRVHAICVFSDYEQLFLFKTLLMW